MELKKLVHVSGSINLTCLVKYITFFYFMRNNPSLMFCLKTLVSQTGYKVLVILILKFQIGFFQISSFVLITLSKSL